MMSQNELDAIARQFAELEEQLELKQKTEALIQVKRLDHQFEEKDFQSLEQILRPDPLQAVLAIFDRKRPDEDVPLPDAKQLTFTLSGKGRERKITAWVRKDLDARVFPWFDTVFNTVRSEHVPPKFSNASHLSSLVSVLGFVNRIKGFETPLSAFGDMDTYEIAQQVCFALASLGPNIQQQKEPQPRPPPTL
jgi:hypothetical protein